MGGFQSNFKLKMPTFNLNLLNVLCVSYLTLFLIFFRLQFSVVLLELLHNPIYIRALNLKGRKEGRGTNRPEGGQPSAGVYLTCLAYFPLEKKKKGKLYVTNDDDDDDNYNEEEEEET